MRLSKTAPRKQAKMRGLSFFLSITVISIVCSTSQGEPPASVNSSAVALGRTKRLSEKSSPPSRLPLTKGTKSLFGVQAANQVEVFVADDVPPQVEKAVRDTLLVAAQTWGSSGRLEYWVTGKDRAAALKLATAFCARRVARGQMTKRRCTEDTSNKDHGFLMYQEIAAKALLAGRPRGSAGHNGGAEWGFHRMNSSLPLGFAGVLNVAGEEEQITILHEYWHSVQNAFIQSQDHEQRRALLGPVWFIEGSAVAMAEWTAAKLWANGKLPKWRNTSHPWQSLRQRMQHKLAVVQKRKAECKNLLPTSYRDPCRQLAYDSGGWAVAYLLHRSGEDVLLKDFHPNVERLGWEACFQKTFGQSSAEFRAEYERFLEQPLREQLKILPQF